MIEQGLPSPLHAGIDEDRLVENIRRSPGAFLELYDRYLVPIYRYLASRVRDPKDAEDLTAQVFLTAFERFSQFQSRGNLAGWLFTIARNKSIDLFRARCREIPLEMVQSRMVIQTDVTSRRDEARTILDIIATFSPEEREVLDLRFAAEMSFAEMAECLHRNESTIKKQVYRLLARIKRELEEKHE